MNRRSLRGILVSLVIMSALLVATVANAFSFTGPYEPQNWHLTGPGTVTVTPASGPASSVTFGYSLNSTATWSQQSWNFSNLATATETFNFNWHYWGFHAWYMTNAAAYAWADGPAGRTTVTLFPSSAVGGGFNASGTASLTLHQGYGFGFTTTGRNYDSDHRLIGNLAITLPDPTPPVITPQVSGTLGSNGWYTTNVTVGWSVSDPESAVTSSTGCGATAVTSDTAGTAFTCTATSQGGTASQTVTVKRDATAPTISGATDRAPNTAGWYNAGVAVGYTCADALSGVASCSGPQTLPAEGANQSATGTAVDQAGNAASATVSGINIDKTAPVTTATAPAGWQNTDVTVALSASDNLSGVKATHYQVDGGAAQTGTSVTVTAEGIHTVNFWSEDNAGNMETAQSVTVKVDKTKPVITHTQAPAPNGFGWNNSDVTVSFSCTDAVSGVASCTPAQTVSTEGAGQSVTGTAVDNAGNSATDTATVNLDKTAPTISGATDRTPNAAGWYNANVTVSFSCSDALSGVATCSGPQTLSSEGANQSATGTDADKAGNSASATVSGISIDKTAPVTTATAPSGWQKTDVTVALSASDNLSGLKATHYTVDGGAVQTGVSVTVSAEGIHTVSFWSEDNAGNAETAKSVTVQIDKTPPEAYIQFDPSGTDVAVYGRDSLSGVQPGPVAPSSVVPVKGEGDGGDGKDSNDNKAELRTYTVYDLAGNRMVMGLKVKKAGHEIKLQVMSLQYNGGAVVTPAPNTTAYEWSADKSGALKELEQGLRASKTTPEVEAKFQAKQNQTTIESGETKTVIPGLVLLRMATANGHLSVEY